MKLPFLEIIGAQIQTNCDKNKNTRFVASIGQTLTYSHFLTYTAYIGREMAIGQGSTYSDKNGCFCFFHSSFGFGPR